MTVVRREATGGVAKPDAVFCLGLFLFAFAVRLYVARALAGEPVWDGHYYDFGARHIATGFGYADEAMREGRAVWHPWCHYPVGYSGFLAAFYILFGTTHTVAHVANALVGGLLPVMTYLLAGEALTPRRATIAGALVAFHPGLVLYAALTMTEPLSALLALASFYVTVRGARSRKPERVALALASGAMVLGVAVLVRPQALLCAPFLGLVVPDWRGRKRWLAMATACVLTLVPVLPWTARNCRVMDGCALVSTNAGWNLAIGAFPRATGRFETLRSEDGCREVTGQVQQDRCWFDYGLQSIKRAPLRWLSLVPAKLGFTFDHESFAVEYLREARPSAWPEDKRVAVRNFLTLIHRALVAVAALGGVGYAFVARSPPEPAHAGFGTGRLLQSALGVGIVAWTIFACASESHAFWPLAVVACILPFVPLPGGPAAPPALQMAVSLLATTVLAHALFFGEDRYHMVATPVLCLLAAAVFRAPPAAKRERDLDRGKA